MIAPKSPGEHWRLDSAGGRVKYIPQCLILAALLASPLGGQTPSVIPLSSEPHHHLVLHNRYVNVYHVEVRPHDAVLLHRHDYDAISIMLDDAQVTVHAPGRPEAHQNLSAAQVRLQPRGYAHSTAIDGDKTYRNVTVELLLPQKGEANLCAAVMAGQPLHCPASQSEQNESNWTEQPQFETDRSTVSLVRVQPHQEMALRSSSGNLLIITIDTAEVNSGKGQSRGETLQQGDFLWLTKGSPAQSIRNNTEKETRIVTFRLKG
jgi:quercetin dioxygenase-like cupin family protein